jgi:hypothetical protein
MCLQLFLKLRPPAHNNWWHLVRGMKANFTTSMFEIEYGQHEMKTGLLRPEKYADRFVESLRIPCCYNASSESFIQYIMDHQWKLGPLD